MGLYLCVFDNGNEVEGVEVGSYSDFDFFRTSVTQQLESGFAGSRFPTLIIHSDSDGEWSSTECETLKRELELISTEFRELPAVKFASEWQQQVASSIGLRPTRLYECFIDVDGEPLLERLQHLCDVSIQNDQPVLFQ
jgi:hypothetical protein